MKDNKDTYQWQKAENFAKFLHLLWDLELIQRYLPERQDILVLLCMLRYADFHTGECTVFINKLAAESGVKHPTQIRRIQDKIVAMGAFWRPEGRKGFKNVNGKWLARYFRSTGKQIIDHALSNNLITEQKLREIELRHVEEEIRAEAEAAMAAAEDSEDDIDFGDMPETLDELAEQERGAKIG